MKKMNETQYDPNATKREGPFVTKLKPRGHYKAFIEAMFFMVGEKKDYKDPNVMVPDYKVRVKFRVDGFPDDDKQFADWFTISNEIASEGINISPKATRKLRGKNLFDALNMRDDKGACKIRAKYGGCVMESQADVDELFTFIKNEPLLVILDKHNEKGGNVYPQIADVDVLEDKTAPF